VISRLTLSKVPRDSICSAHLLSFYFIVLSFTKHINEISIKINDSIVFQANKSKKLVPSTKTTLTFKKPYPANDKTMIRINSSIHTEQTFTIDHGPSITLNHVDVEASINMDKNLHDKLQQSLKKNLPSTIHIQLLFPSNNVSLTLCKFAKVFLLDF
jgi:hypothetical protein